ncbi:MAG: 50S ribosomal protein L11 methyltransferase [Clostridia bacterium]|nr:50S ribosomal protein L11 methyltransferase [Clostridia bacterium]
MKWYEITVNTNTEGADLIADAFFSIGCVGGVKIIDKNDVIDIIKHNKMWDYVDEALLQSIDTVQVSGYVSQDEKDRKLDELKGRLNELTQFGVMYSEIVIVEIDDELWHETWKKYYRPIDAGRYVVIPKWIKYETSDRIKILMDPGMAFGTGEHESTRMCLELMSEIDFVNKDVIDVGTGSGILGIGAIKSGAKSCYMCDIDSVAVKAAQENAVLNEIADKVDIELADLLQKDIVADVVLANLTAGILKRLAIGLSKHMKANGVLICSGIIHERKEAVIQAFEENGFHLEKSITMGEWNALKFLWI